MAVLRMSAFGTKQTCKPRLRISALRGITDNDADVTRCLLMTQSGHDVWSTLRRKVHEIPIRPDRVDVICRQFSSPEMENLPILFPKHMHHRPLHIIGIALAFVVGLIGRVRSGNQPDLRPSTLFGPRIDPVGRGFGNCTNAASRVTEYQVQSNPSTSDVQEGQGWSQFGPYIHEESSRLFLSPNNSENFTLFPSFPSLPHWNT
jgi:hypothetical protein